MSIDKNPMSLKQTAFTNIHKSLGAKIVEFAGFEMPVQYSGIVDEHKCVRTRVGIFDVSHMGEVEVAGRGALEFVQKITVNDASKLDEGRVQYSAMCYPDGGIVDDLLVYNLGDRFMLVINASNTAKDIAWMKENLSGDAELRDRSDATSLLAVQGPRSREVLQQLTDVDLGSLEYYHCTRGVLSGVEMIISRTGYTGEHGYELYFPSSVATGEKVWNSIMKAGKQFGILPIGLGARDTLRLEMGFCLYGNDIDQNTHPLEAGLGWITKLEKGKFNGKDVLVRAKQEGLKRRLVGFTVDDRAFPRHGYQIHAAGGPTGTVTSGTFSPVLEKGIGMGYVGAAHAKVGTPVSILIRDREVPATIAPLPFMKNSAT
jgi:aminomethyltransferase